MSNTPLFNTKPVEKALTALKKFHEDIASAERSAASVREDVRNRVANIDPDDEASISTLASRQVQAEMYPRYIARRKEGHLALVEALLPAIQELDSAVLDQYKADAKAFEEEGMTVFRSIYGKHEHKGEVVQSGGRQLWQTKQAPALEKYNHPAGMVNGIGQIAFFASPSVYFNPGKQVEEWEEQLTRIAADVMRIAATYKPYVRGSFKKAILTAAAA